MKTVGLNIRGSLYESQTNVHVPSNTKLLNDNVQNQITPLQTNPVIVIIQVTYVYSVYGLPTGEAAQRHWAKKNCPFTVVDHNIYFVPRRLYIIIHTSCMYRLNIGRPVWIYTKSTHIPNRLCPTILCSLRNPKLVTNSHTLANPVYQVNTVAA